MSLGGGDHSKDDGTEDSDANANKDMLTSPDIWINQGHIQMAKGNYVAARNYEQAQQRFFFGMDPRVALYQARNHYEANNMEEAKVTLKRALHVAPWDLRLRFNLAYVYQEHAHRDPQPHPQGSREGEAARRGTKAGWRRCSTPSRTSSSRCSSSSRSKRCSRLTSRRRARSPGAGDWH